MGVLETIQIRKNTFPFRLYYSNFIGNYKCLINVDKSFERLSVAEQSVGILRRLFPGIEKQKNSYQLGNEKIYLKDEHQSKLNELLLKEYQRKDKAALLIQNTVRKYRLRNSIILNLRKFLKKMKLLCKIVKKYEKSRKQIYFLKYRQIAKQKTQAIKDKTKTKIKQEKLTKLSTILKKLSPIFQRYQRFIFFTKLKFVSQ